MDIRCCDVRPSDYMPSDFMPSDYMPSEVRPSAMLGQVRLYAKRSYAKEILCQVYYYGPQGPEGPLGAISNLGPTLLGPSLLGWVPLSSQVRVAARRARTFGTTILFVCGEILGRHVMAWVWLGPVRGLTKPKT